MNNWIADEMLAYEQLREARAQAARSRSLAAMERRRRPGVMRAWLAAALISLGERLAQPQESESDGRTRRVVTTPLSGPCQPVVFDQPIGCPREDF